MSVGEEKTPSMGLQVHCAALYWDRCRAEGRGLTQRRLEELALNALLNLRQGLGQVVHVVVDGLRGAGAGGGRAQGLCLQLLESGEEGRRISKCYAQIITWHSKTKHNSLISRQ